MERHPSGRGPEPESAVRTTDVANRRIVAVRPEQTTAVTATARHLRRQLTSLTAALETLPLGRESLAVVGSESSAQAAARETHLASPALRMSIATALHQPLTRRPYVRLVWGSDRRNVAGEVEALGYPVTRTRPEPDYQPRRQFIF